MFAVISKSLSKANTHNHIISRRLISKLTFCEVQGYVIKVLIKKKFSQSTQANTSFSLPHSQRRQVAGDQRRHQLRGESDSQNPKRELNHSLFIRQLRTSLSIFLFLVIASKAASLSKFPRCTLKISSRLDWIILSFPFKFLQRTHGVACGGLRVCVRVRVCEGDRVRLDWAS